LDPTLFVDADRSHSLRRTLNRIQIAIADFNALLFKLWIQRGEKASIESGGASDLLPSTTVEHVELKSIL
jgi:hypothetical protein